MNTLPPPLSDASRRGNPVAGIPLFEAWRRLQPLLHKLGKQPSTHLTPYCVAGTSLPSQISHTPLAGVGRPLLSTHIEGALHASQTEPPAQTRPYRIASWSRHFYLNCWRLALQHPPSGLPFLPYNAFTRSTSLPGAFPLYGGASVRPPTAWPCEPPRREIGSPWRPSPNWDCLSHPVLTWHSLPCSSFQSHSACASVKRQQSDLATSSFPQVTCQVISESYPKSVTHAAADQPRAAPQPSSLYGPPPLLEPSLDTGLICPSSPPLPSGVKSLVPFTTPPQEECRSTPSAVLAHDICGSKDTTFRPSATGADGKRKTWRDTTLATPPLTPSQISLYRGPIPPWGNTAPSYQPSRTSFGIPLLTSRPTQNPRQGNTCKNGAAMLESYDGPNFHLHLWTLTRQLHEHMSTAGFKVEQLTLYQTLQEASAVAWSRRITLQSPQLWDRLITLFDDLRQVNWKNILDGDYSADLSSTISKASADIALRGLGKRGQCPIPDDIWDKAVPPSLVELLKAYVPLAPHCIRDPSNVTKMLLHKLAQDGFLCTYDGPTNANVFVRPKSSEKVALIADLRGINTKSPQPKPTFHLPSLEDIGRTITSHQPGTLWGSTIDISNFFWSLMIPDHAIGMFRVDGYAWPCLPFGWDLSPYLAQETLGRIIWLGLLDGGLLPFLWHSIHVFHYYDDILILATSTEACSITSHAILKLLESKQLPISTKSILQPVQHLVWIGKRFNLQMRTVENTHAVQLRSLAMALLLMVIRLHSKIILRLLGYMLWAFRPHRGGALWLRSWYQTLTLPTRCLGTAGLQMKRGLLDTLVLTWLPWHARTPNTQPMKGHIICGDAGRVGGGYQTGMFSPSLGIRIIRCPHEVANQQIAELFALDAATRVAARLGWTECTYVGDNAASLQMVHTMRPSLHNTVMCQILRRIRNRLLWTAMTVHLLWVPSGLQPGDPSSRCPSLTAPTLAQMEHDTWNRWNNLQSSLEYTRYIGTAWA